MIEVRFWCPQHCVTVQPMGGQSPEDMAIPVGPKMRFADVSHTHPAEHYWTFDLSEMECEMADPDDDEDCRVAWTVSINMDAGPQFKPRKPGMCGLVWEGRATCIDKAGHAAGHVPWNDEEELPPGK